MNAKTALKIFCVSIFTVSLFSCDPPHAIFFSNDSNSNVKVVLNLNPKIENYHLRELAVGDSIVLDLKNEGISMIEFGIGQWSDKEIGNIANSIRSIQIETKDVKTIYKTNNSIQSLFIKNRKGYIMRSEIQIEIK